MSDPQDFEPTNPIDRFVDRVVIRSTSPVEPWTSHSWVILRAVAVAFLATMPGLYMINQGFGSVGLIVATANMLITINIMSTRFNQRIERMRAEDAVSHGPCVKHRCISCHRIFDSVMHGTECPHCSGSSICSSENREECQ